MRFLQIKHRTEGNNAGRINLRVRHIIMTLDVIEIDGISDARLLIQIHQITLQIWIVDDTVQVALEMAVIHGVEANKSAKKSPVCFDNAVPKQVSTFGQTLFELVERFKKSAARNLIRPLARSETRPVNAIVYIVVQKIGELRVLGFDGFWEKIDVLILGELIKYIIEHATDVVFAIINDPFSFLVPKHRHGDALIVIWVGCLVSFTKKLKAVDRIG